MSVLGKHRNEMTAVYLAKSYYLPSLTCGCEVWNNGQSALHKVNVVWNACFQRIFCGFYRESIKPLQCFYGALSVSYFVHQHKLMF